MSDSERFSDVLFPEYYEDIFAEEDPDFRFRLIRRHIHPKLRMLLAGCLDCVSDLLETDPLTFSKMGREPKTHDGDLERLRCALYGLKPNEVRGRGFPNLRSSSGRGRHIADFDLSFFADRDGLGLELHVGRIEEIKLLRQVYGAHRDRIDALMTFMRLGVDGSNGGRMLSLKCILDSAIDSGEGWVAVFDTRYPFPVPVREFMSRFEECFIALYLLYDAMLSRALGIEDHFDEQFSRLEQHLRDSAQIDGTEPPRFG